MDKDKKPKSQSARLRHVLFRLWEQEPQGFDNSEDYYQAQMERIITHFKSKLD